jgi:gamma-glutamylcysteine synthetase
LSTGSAVLESGGGLVSTELEAPVVSLRDGAPAPPEVFASVWRSLACDAWRPGEFGVWRERRETPRVLAISSAQMMASDTGPTLEIAPSPSHSLTGTARQLESLLGEARTVLERLGYAMLGSAVHPTVRAQPEDYYRYRTPRLAYDYVIGERRWNHWSILNIASLQEIVDVSFDDAPRALRVLHRLAGLMNFVLRNDPDLHGEHGGCLSVRPRAWRSHVPPGAAFDGDAGKVVLPTHEIGSWQDYLELLWAGSPMFLVGTKNRGAAWVPEHPTFIRFALEAPEGGWPARTLAGEPLRIVPERAHLEKTDWTYMGFARIRWRWREGGGGLAELAEAWREGAIERFLRENLEKVVIENRCNSAQPPGEALASLYLVTGLLANLHETSGLAFAEPWPFWNRVLDASTTERLDAVVDGRSVPEYAREMIAIARRGLALRGEADQAGALDVLDRRIEERSTPAERMLAEHRRGGLEAVLRQTRL